MLTNETIQTIKKQAESYWQSETKKPQIMEIAQGKEIGHKLADLVDEKTVALLTLFHVTKFQRSDKGEKRSRSMGDVWLLDNSIYHPINVKVGIIGSEGQPNLVSLKKTMTAIINQQIDSYYLLIIKMKIQADFIEPSIYLIDMLDYLDFLAFDSGPGQLMLKAKQFFREFTPRPAQDTTIKQKVEGLMRIYEDGERRLKENREHDLQLRRKAYQQFMNIEAFSVTSATQKGLNLQ